MKPIVWWKRKEIWGTLAQAVGAVLMLLPATSTAYKVGVAIGIAVGTGTQIEGLLSGYSANNLPSGITKVLDTIPNSITGTKGGSVK